MLKPIVQAACYAVAEALQRAVNSLLETDGELRNSMSALSGKSLRLEISDAGVSIDALFSPAGIALVLESESEPDILIRGTLASFATLPLRQSGESIDFDGIEVTGNLRLAQQIYRVCRTADIDYEEVLARRLGDIPARTICSAVRRAKANARKGDAKDRISEIMTHKLAYLPQRSRAEQFLDDVDTVVADVDRLELHIERLGGAGR